MPDCSDCKIDYLNIIDIPICTIKTLENLLVETCNGNMKKTIGENDTMFYITLYLSTCLATLVVYDRCTNSQIHL
jgi:hypothetical protein